MTMNNNQKRRELQGGKYSRQQDGGAAAGAFSLAFVTQCRAIKIANLCGFEAAYVF
jgi:hypothetical protein